MMMDKLDDWFPYSNYRPHQRAMLEVVAKNAREGGIVMIDAPTGSGKSSSLSALLSERSGKKVIVAVRTISQLNTFIREIAMIRKKQPGLKSAYLIGKSHMCPLSGEGDVYRRCEGVKAYTMNLIRQRAEAGSLIPAKDPVVQQQIRRMDRSHPLLCPYFIQSRVFIQADGAGLKLVPSAAVRTRAERVNSEQILPHQLNDLSSGICPYEMMVYAAQRADVVVVNYHHLFADDIRGQLYTSLMIEPQDVLLLLDEAHNCGEVMQSIQSVTLSESMLQQVTRDLSQLKKSFKGVDAILHLLPGISRFMDGLKNSDEQEDWFDAAIFDRMVVGGSLYPSMEAIVEDLMRMSEKVRENAIRAGEYRETAIELLTEFFFRLSQSAADPAYLTLYRKEEGEIRLEVRNIDPGTRIRELTGAHHCCILISGTLSPVSSYKRYYFDDLPVTCCSLPNAFPREQRLIVCTTDITTAYSLRQDKENNIRIISSIIAFSLLPGNLAIYFPSYQILDTFATQVAPMIRKKQIFIEPKDAREADIALKTFLSLPSRGNSGILLAVCGGKWSEGLDYRGEMLSGAMVIGLPLAPFNRVRQMIIEYFRHKFGDEGEFISYTLPALNRALQALGRVLRTPEDRGVLVFGDRRFLEPRIRAALPEWIRSELVDVQVNNFGRVLTSWR
jgi:DNA excision repair protein ERCC-2